MFQQTQYNLESQIKILKGKHNLMPDYIRDFKKQVVVRNKSKFALDGKIKKLETKLSQIKNFNFLAQ